jgi:hypothetical protein
LLRVHSCRARYDQIKLLLSPGCEITHFEVDSEDDLAGCGMSAEERTLPEEVKEHAPTGDLAVKVRSRVVLPQAAAFVPDARN